AIADTNGDLVDMIIYPQLSNKFTGRELDTETGLQFNLARRWTSQDPLGFDAGDENLYRYVHNAPTIARDSSGLQHDLSFVTRFGPRTGSAGAVAWGIEWTISADSNAQRGGIVVQHLILLNFAYYFIGDVDVPAGSYTPPALRGKARNYWEAWRVAPGQ